MSDDVQEQLDRLVSTVEQQQEIIEEQRERIVALETEAQTDGTETEPGPALVDRRDMLKAGGLLALLVGGVGTASANPQGQVGTSNDPLNALYADSVRTGTVGSAAGEGLTVETDDGTRVLDLGVPQSGDDGQTAGGNVVAGHPDNTAGDAVGVVVSGGGKSGSKNSATEHYATVGGGEGNTASGDQSTVGGGVANTASDNYAIVGGGDSNTASGASATIAGGFSNAASDDYAAVGGGFSNTASGEGATVSGAGRNTASGRRATVSGSSNTASGNAATVSGGEQNTASGGWATVPSGLAGAAVNSNSFVWNDGTEYHDIPNSLIDGLSSDKTVASDSSDPAGANTFSVSATGGVRFITGSDQVTYLTDASTGWTSASSRTVKTNINSVDPREALAGVEEMEVATWEYEDDDGEGAGTTHIGPMAEDFHEVFDVGSSDKHINSINADGVALAAIQGLSAELGDARADLAAKDDIIDEQAARIDDLEADTETLREENEQLRERLDAIEAHLGVDEPASQQAVADD